MVLFEGLPTIDGKQLLNDMGWSWPDLEAPQNMVRGEHEVGFAIGDAAVLLVNNSFPIDYADFADRGVSEKLWPGSINSLMRHQSHTVVSVIMENRRATDVFALATKITASVLAASTGSLGVYWPSTPQLISRNEFTDRVSSLPSLPLDLWVDVKVGKGRDGSVTASTTGLTAFGLRELEQVDGPESADAARIRLTNLVSQMLRHRRNIVHGATLGYDSTWRVAVEVGPSRLGRSSDVSHIVFEPASNEEIIEVAAPGDRGGYPPPLRREARAEPNQRSQRPEYQS